MNSVLILKPLHHAAPPRPGRTATHLIVEDDNADRHLLPRARAKVGVTNPMEMLRDGFQVMSQLAQSRSSSQVAALLPVPVLLLLDLGLPRCSGLEVLRWLQGEPTLRQLPIVVLTSQEGPGELAKAEAWGASDHLLKPGRPIDRMRSCDGSAHWVDSG